MSNYYVPVQTITQQLAADNSLEQGYYNIFSFQKILTPSAATRVLNITCDVDSNPVIFVEMWRSMATVTNNQYGAVVEQYMILCNNRVLTRFVNTLYTYVQGAGCVYTVTNTTGTPYNYVSIFFTQTDVTTSYCAGYGKYTIFYDNIDRSIGNLGIPYQGPQDVLASYCLDRASKNPYLTTTYSEYNNVVVLDTINTDYAVCTIPLDPYNGSNSTLLVRVRSTNKIRLGNFAGMIVNYYVFQGGAPFGSGYQVFNRNALASFTDPQTTASINYNLNTGSPTVVPSVTITIRFTKVASTLYSMVNTQVMTVGNTNPNYSV